MSTDKADDEENDLFCNNKVFLMLNHSKRNVGVNIFNEFRCKIP